MSNSVLRGWGAVDKLKKEAAERSKAFEEGKLFAPRAFPVIVKDGSDKYPDNADVTFLEGDPTILPLVTYKTADGKWQTRRYKGKSDPINNRKDIKPKQTCLFTVIDHTEGSYTNSEGLEVSTKDRKKYVALSVNQADGLSSSMRRLKRKLDGGVINISKSGRNTNFLPIDKDEEVHTLPEDVSPWNFEDVFPLDAEAAIADDAPAEENVKY